MEGLSGVETEPNDTSSSADSLELGESVTGKLSSSFDEDRFEVSVPGSGVLTIDFTVPSGSTGKWWYVRALRNGSTSYGSVSFNASGSQTIALGEGGVFDLEVYNSSYSSHSSAEYTLTATFD